MRVYADGLLHLVNEVAYGMTFEYVCCICTRLWLVTPYFSDNEEDKWDQMGYDQHFRRGTDDRDESNDDFIDYLS